MLNSLQQGKRVPRPAIDQQAPEVKGGSWIDNVAIGLIFIAYLCLQTLMPQGDGTDWANFIDTNKLYINQNYILMVPSVSLVKLILSLVGIEATAFNLMQIMNAAAATAMLVGLSAILRLFHVSQALRLLMLVIAGFSYNMLYLATCDHIKIFAGPFLVWFSYYVLSYGKDGQARQAFWAGVFLGLASAYLINSILCLIVLPVLLIMGPKGWGRAAWTDGLLFLVPALAVPCLVLLGFYVYVAPPLPFLAWLATYGKGGAAAVDAGFQSVTLISVLRAPFGLLNNFVNSSVLGPTLKSLLTQRSMSGLNEGGALWHMLSSLTVGVCVLVLVIRTIRTWRTLPAPVQFAMAAMWMSVLAFAAFAIAWNSSEEEFWYQVTIPVCVMAALLLVRLPRRLIPVFPAIVLGAVLVSNVFGYALPRRMIPFSDLLVRAATSVPAGSFIITDGLGPSVLAITMSKATRAPGYKTHEALAVLKYSGKGEAQVVDYVHQSAQAAIASGGCVYGIAVFDANPLQHPWTLLSERTGLSPKVFARALTITGKDNAVRWFYDTKIWVVHDDRPDWQQRCVDPFDVVPADAAQVKRKIY